MTPDDSSSTSFSLDVQLRLLPAEVWDLMWRPAGQRRWLGPGSCIDLNSSGRWALVDEAGTWRIARRVGVQPSVQVTMMIESAPGWMVGGETRVTIRIEPAGEGESVVSIEETGIPAGHSGEIERYWSSRLERLSALVDRLRRRRKRVRQAVVVIHGIGEQQPGESLTSLVDSGVLASTDEQRAWVKPDRASGSYELRSVVLEATETRPTTDVFEFYWAHVIRDTTLGQVGGWVRRLLCRRSVPAPLRPLWVVAWIATLAVLVGATAALFDTGLARWFAATTLLTVAAGVLWRFIGRPLAINFLGDAARYLMPHPANIAHRQTIREAGVHLIETLHASGKYDRIVILGHSLGSVIAYDIVTHAWIGMHQAHQCPARPAFKDVIGVERHIEIADTDAAQNLQHAAWRQQRTNTQPWLITDLVTAGSPLTYADFLMAADESAFEAAKADRVLPTCPPTTETESKSGFRRVTFDRSYRDAIDGSHRTFSYFHHGAPFAVTRWTNLYFETERLGTSGDIIGGPVAPQFGPWVRDVPLRSPGAGFTHTWYWRPTADSDVHLKALSAALNLDAREELIALRVDRPVSALLGEDVQET